MRDEKSVEAFDAEAEMERLKAEVKYWKKEKRFMRSEFFKELRRVKTPKKR